MREGIDQVDLIKLERRIREVARRVSRLKENIDFLRVDLMQIERILYGDIQKENDDTIKELTTRVESLSSLLSTRGHNTLNALMDSWPDVKTISDLCTLSEEDLLKLRNTGKTTVDEFNSVLSTHFGVKLQKWA